MSSTNLVILSGRLGQNPELRHTTFSAIPVCRISLAIEPAKRKDDPRTAEQKAKGSDTFVPFDDGTIFVDVTLWRNAALNAVKWLSVGRMVIVEGHLTMNSFVDKETGKARQNLRVVGDIVRYLDNKGQQTIEAVDDDNIGDAPAPAPTPVPVVATPPKPVVATPAVADDTYLGVPTKRTSRKPKATL